MSCTLPVRAAACVLALLVLLTGIRTAAASCCADDCARPCCERDASHSTVVPVLPCCRTVAADQAPLHAASTKAERERPPLTAPGFVVTPLIAVVLRAVAPARGASLLPSPPLYQRHCALLL